MTKMARYFKYLDDLRESGITNMWGASPYLEQAFNLDEKVARVITKYWMESFDGKTKPAERAKAYKK